MGKIKKFDRGVADKISSDVVKEIAALCERHGITVRDAGGTFDSGTFTGRFKFEVEDAGRINFERNAPSYGFKPKDFGREFTTEDGTFRIVGFSPSRKYAVDVVNVNTGEPGGYRPHAVVDALLTPKERAQRDAKQEAQAKATRRKLVTEHPDWLAQMNVSPEERAELEKLVKKVVTAATT